jgi:hypothetical protein
MATVITAGNATNGLSLSADNTGSFQFKTGTGAGTTAITVDSSQNTTFAGTAAVSTGTLYPIVSGTAVASTSGTSIDFTGIPTWVKRVTVMFNNVSTNGTSPFLIQIGAGSVTTSGYQSAGSTIVNGSVTGVATSTAGFVCSNGNSAAGTVQGAYRVNLIGSNIWVAEGNTFNTNSNQLCVMAGGITLGGTLDRVRITTVGGTNTFDLGTLNILYE